MKAHPTAILVLFVACTALAADAPSLEALTPTSGTGAEQVLDGNPTAGWRPDGDPSNEGLLLRLEEPTAFGSVGVRGCAGSPSAQVEVSVDGQPIGSPQAVTADKETVFSFSELAHRSLFVKLVAPAPAQACIGEIQVSKGGKALALKPPRSVPGRIQASSVLTPADAYHPGFLFDGRTDFGWVEGAKGTGAGESITLTLDSPLELKGLELWNGYQRSMDHFKKNARVAQLSLSVDGGAPIVLKVGDKSGPQVISLPAPVKGKTFKLTVDKAIAGSKYPDLVLSELRLVDAQGTLTVRTPDMEERRKVFQGELANTSLAKVVDQSWYNRCAEQSGLVVRTLKLRSNHTFVFYDNTQGEGDPDKGVDESKEVLDGAWVVKKSAKPWTAIELYGRRHVIRTTTGWVPYGDVEEKSTESTRIGGGTLEIARVADLDEKAFQQLAAEWLGGVQGRSVGCLATAGHTYKELVAVDALFVRGPAVTDLFSR
ncbi:NADase-type glycan-binding domain-containing protein [Hyalangium versicolor]|uniref:NADase-type glycan-binding domain-containing protein n=1 Tax=Hyalangium versicolor TaxID=2861190 RepID=UPI001CCB784C|nr:hypothetical protein [Hyalangium versicolor]